MFKRTLTLAAFMAVFAIAAASGAFATGIVMPNEGLATIGGNVEPVRFCPITIACKKGTKAKCEYNKKRHRCVCRCVPRHPM
jgi:hypothetical protein